MATGNVILTVIDVGQGQCTFIEIYDRSAPAVLMHTLLIDCGSNKYSNATITNLSYIALKASRKEPAGFDCIFFSHSDTDHTNLTIDLLIALREKVPAGDPLTIGKVWFAGERDHYTKGQDKFNILDYIELKGYCPWNEIKALMPEHSDYDPARTGFPTNLWATPDKTCRVCCVMANALSEDPDWDEQVGDRSLKTPEAKNRVSLVCGVFYAGLSYIICGDATNSTMSTVNRKFNAPGVVFPTNIMSTLPHHGSRRTGLAVAKGQTASDEAINVVKTFSALLNSRLLTDSAYEKQSHPSLELMKLFLPRETTPVIYDPRLKDRNSHRLTAFIDVDLGNVTGMLLFNFVAYTFETTTNIFTTRYSRPDRTFSCDLALQYAWPSLGTNGQPINEFACWLFITEPNGVLRMGGYPMMGSPLFTATASEMEMTTPPVPPVRFLNHPPANRQSPFHNRIQRFR